MNYKKVIKRETKIIVYVVICLTLSIIGVSYAMFLQVDKNSNFQTIEAGVFRMEIPQEGNLLSNEICLDPSSTEEDVQANCVRRFSVTNTGLLPARYTVYIYNNTNTSETGFPSEAQFADHKNLNYTFMQVQNDGTVIKDLAGGTHLLNTIPEETVGSNRRVLHTAILDKGAVDVFALKLWMNEDAQEDIINQYVALKLDIIGNVYDDESASQLLTSTLDEETGLTEIISDEISKDITARKEYRYVGANPNNYVYFNCTDNGNTATCERWRILGISNIGGENLIKIVKNITGDTTEISQLNKQWATDSGAAFGTSYIKNYLNVDYYNTLSAKAQDQIAEVPYKLTGSDALNISSYAMFDTEYKSTSTVTAKVGLMSVSDYALASGLAVGTTLENVHNMNANNWLFNSTFNEWLITKPSTGNNIYYRNIVGNFATDASNTTKIVRPVVYLKNTTKLKMVDGVLVGNGTSGTPYILE